MDGPFWSAETVVYKESGKTSRSRYLVENRYGFEIDLAYWELGQRVALALKNGSARWS